MSLRVAGRWYETTSFADGVTLVHEPHVSVDVRCNIWHVRGRDRDLLVDSGMGMRPLREEVALLRERPVLAVASHSHFDHVGALHEFEHRLAHAAEASVLATPDAESTVWAPFAARPILHALPEPGYRTAAYAVRPAPPTRLIDEGDELDLGDRLFKVFHMPGHSPGSLCLYEASTETLFTGDVVYDGGLVDDLYHSDPDVYVETMKRLKEIPARTFHCGHYASFGRERLHELVDAYLASRGGPLT